MVAIRLPALITNDKQLIVKLPADIEPGEVEIVIHPQPQTPSTITNPAREAARAKLAAAGKLSNAQQNVDHLPLPPDEPPFVLPPGARGSEELVNEDREER